MQFWISRMQRIQPCHLCSPPASQLARLISTWVMRLVCDATVARCDRWKHSLSTPRLQCRSLNMHSRNPRAVLRATFSNSLPTSHRFLPWNRLRLRRVKSKCLRRASPDLATRPRKLPTPVPTTTAPTASTLLHDCSDTSAKLTAKLHRADT
jgi:hypothetical protein